MELVRLYSNPEAGLKRLLKLLVSNGPLLRERTGIAEDSAWAGSCWACLAENLNVRRGGRRCLCGACEPVSQHGAEGRHENRGLLP